MGSLGGTLDHITFNLEVHLMAEFSVRACRWEVGLLEDRVIGP